MSTTKRRTKQERLELLQEKQRQLKEQEKKLKAQLSNEERKKRTKNLIQLGGAVCKVLNEDTVEGDTITENDISNLIAFLKNQNARGNYFTKAMQRTPKPREEQQTTDTETNK